MPRWTDLERACAEVAAVRDDALDASVRQRHGVVHTPPALARAIARRSDRALRALGYAGLADPAVRIIDPACGPGAFLAAAVAVSEGRARPIGLDRDAQVVDTARLLFGPRAELRVADALADGRVFEGARALCVLGNPPWSARTGSRPAYSDQLLEDFRREPDGGVLQERKTGVLSDVYVRFWRWALEGLRSRRGVVAFVSNASFLDGPVHRGMRAAMQRWCDHIDVLDLGGSALVARRGDPDQNVFGVRVGVAITVAARDEGGPTAPVRYARLRGTAEDKLARLDVEQDVEGAEREVAPGEPWPPPRDDEASCWPASWRSLDALFPFHREGVQSNRDAFATDVDRDVLLARLRAFADGDDLGLVPRAHFDLALARARLAEAFAAGRAVVFPLAYRPGVTRWCVRLAPLCHRPRPALLAAMERSPGALVAVRKDRGERPYTHFGYVQHTPDNCFLSSRSSCRARAFPTHLADGTPNLSERGAEWFESVHDAHAHVLATLADPTYRHRYEWLLKQHYPRVPPPSNGSLARGRQLRDAFAAEGERRPMRLGHHEALLPAALAALVPDLAVDVKTKR